MTRRKKEERGMERARVFVFGKRQGLCLLLIFETISRRGFNGGLAERRGNEGDEVK